MPELANNLQEFVMYYLKSSGGRVINFDKDLIEVELSEKLQKILHMSKRLNLAFSQDTAKKVSGAEYVTYGSEFLNRVLEVTQSRGQTSKFYLNVPLDFEKFDELLGRLEFLNSQLSATVPRLVYYPHVLFNFKISYISDEKTEDMDSLIVDPGRGEISDNMSVLKYASPNSQVKEYYEKDFNDVAQAYDLACKEMRRRIQTHVNKFVFESNSRLQKELSMLKNYYSDLIDEFQKGVKELEDKVVENYYKMKNARKDSTREQYKQAYYKCRKELDEMKAEVDDKLEKLNREKLIRIGEQKEKFRPKVRLTITNTAIILVPRLEQKMSLVNEMAERKIEVLYDILENRFLDFRCERCSKDLEIIYLCRNSHIVCKECTKLCASCGQAICKDCYMERCGVCGRYVCPTCYKKCKECGGAACTEHRRQCSECGETFCMSCIEQCEVCAEYFCSNHMEYCHRCDNTVCRKHSSKCKICSDIFCDDFIVKCEVCNNDVCFKHGDKCHICGKMCCQEHISRCVLCGESVCAEHSGYCHICEEPYCREHLSQCPICEEQYCEFNKKNCSTCHQEYCGTCIIDRNCYTCRTITATIKQDERVKNLVDGVGLPLNYGKFWGWQVGENNKYIVIIAMNILRPYVFILCSNTLEVIDWYKGGAKLAVTSILRYLKY